MAENEKNTVLEKGSYEIIKNRLNDSSKVLQEKINLLNTERNNTFGNIPFELINSEMMNTEHNCVARDIFTLPNNLFLFAYNVHFGLKTNIELNDVFSMYQFDVEQNLLHSINLDFINDEAFVNDFKNLFKYYRDTTFHKFLFKNSFLYMVFRVGKSTEDIKVFKWALIGNQLKYENNRSDHEYTYPTQQEFNWVKTTRDDQRFGNHPHISIKDKVFVETIGGDLTIKIEDNTDQGHGILAEPVDHADQTLDDAEIFYAIINELILLKVKPYQESNFRYFIYNTKLKTAIRNDEIGKTCVLLPADQGLIFPNGFYLQSGENKLFDTQLPALKFERKIASPNGEDYLYVFFSEENGSYLLLSYNTIKQEVETPVLCQGFTLFENGKLIFFKTDEEAKKHHSIQIWQSPYYFVDYQIEADTSSFLYKLGNKTIVNALSECNELIKLLFKETLYNEIYLDITRKAQEIIDTYHWLNKKECFELETPILEIRKTAQTAIAEFEKRNRQIQETKQVSSSLFNDIDKTISEIKSQTYESIDVYVKYLSAIRQLQGQLIELENKPYAVTDAINEKKETLEERTTLLSQETIEFLLRPNALEVYRNKLNEFGNTLNNIQKDLEAEELLENIDTETNSLELLIETISNLEIKDTTKSTQVIDDISLIFASYNQLKAKVKKERKQLQSAESSAEFASQLKLLEQSVINYLDVSDTPEKVEDFLSKLMVKVEELESKFVQFDDFLEKLAEKREDIYNAFDNKKIQLSDQRNKKALKIYNSSKRIISSISNKAATLNSASEINAYIASDIMVSKLRKYIKQLIEIGENVKADELESKLKSISDDTLRQLKDKQEIYADGGNTIKFGKHAFSVNQQNIDLSIVPFEDKMACHITGTAYFDTIEDAKFNAFKTVWDQDLVSENKEVYRAEYLAYTIFNELNGAFKTNDELKNLIKTKISNSYQEAYIKGIHDFDAEILLAELIKINQQIGLLAYSSNDRFLAKYFWKNVASTDFKESILKQMIGVKSTLEIFPNSKEFKHIKAQLFKALEESKTQLPYSASEKTSSYLFDELIENESFIISSEAAEILQHFNNFIKQKRKEVEFKKVIKQLQNNGLDQYFFVLKWIKEFILHFNENLIEYQNEVCGLILFGDFQEQLVNHTKTSIQLNNLLGEHSVLEDGGVYTTSFQNFFIKLDHYVNETLPSFEAFKNYKKEYSNLQKESLKLNEFQPKVMSSFVRNKLINDVYFPLIGDNLAKQIGAAGNNKRTDLMGLLLLVSPPGYGKTTLMEYIANRIGLIFVKINGPSIGHEVTSLDPTACNNLAAKQEIEKLNLAFEMGDNVMIYLDDIQHCNPEFLQKFISLCDGQRKIEGVHKGKSKTYDFRGKKVAVVMAGNPYTESGEKFQIPDMLANRADIYNLGDISGGENDTFELSYIENALSSNPITRDAFKDHYNDLYTFIKGIETNNFDLEFEADYSQDVITDLKNILEKIVNIKEIVLKMNQQYIASANQQDAYRTEPAFKLQGSYRNMNKMVEKLSPMMNEEELKELIVSHYTNESQTLTQDAEFNLLKFKELFESQKKEEKSRINAIRTQFVKQNKLKGMGDNQQIASVLEQMESISDNIASIGNDQEEQRVLINQLKALTEGVQAISNVLIINRGGKVKE